MHVDLIQAYILTEYGRLTALAFERTYKNSNFKLVVRSFLRDIHEIVGKVLDADVLSDKAAPEIQSYYDDLSESLNA